MADPEDGMETEVQQDRPPPGLQPDHDNHVHLDHVTPELPTKVIENDSPSQQLLNGHSEARSSSPAAEVNGTAPKSLPLPNGSAATTSAGLDLGSVDEQVKFLKDALSKASPEAAQKLLRQNWRSFLFDSYSEEHISYVMRAGLKNSQAQTLERIFKDESLMRGSLLLKTLSKKRSIVTAVLEEASLNDVASFLPEAILDKALAERLKNVPAKELIRWLAEADRLGYSLDDILDETDETVRPNLPGLPSDDGRDADIVMANSNSASSRPPLDIALPYRDPVLDEQNHNLAQQRQQQQQSSERLTPNLPLTCPACHAQFSSMSGYTHHITKKVRAKEVPAGGFQHWCYNCRQGFSTKQGRDYHRANDVCDAPKNAQGQLLDLNYTNPSPATGPPTVSFQAPPAPPQHHVQQPHVQYQAPMVQYTPQQQAQPHYLNQAQAQVQAPPPLPPMSNFPIVQNGNFPPRPTASSQQIPFSTPQNTPSQNTPRSRSEKVVPGRQLSPSDLTPSQLSDMNAKLAAAEARYQADIAAIPADATQADRERRMTTLKQGHATRKSMIRKSFGVSLRMRARERAAKEANAASTPSQPPRLEAYRAPPAPPINNFSTNSATSSMAQASSRPVPVVSGFSPINAPPRNTPRAGATPLSQNQSPSIPQQPFRGSPLGSNLTPADEQARKRRRTSQDGSYDAPVPQPLLQPQMQHHSPHLNNQNPGNAQNPPPSNHGAPLSSSTQDAAPKKVPVKDSQARWEALQPKGGAIATANSRPGSSGTGTGEVIVLSSSESGSGTEDNERRSTSATQNTAASVQAPGPASMAANTPAFNSTDTSKADSNAPTASINDSTAQSALAAPTAPMKSTPSQSPNITNGTLPSQAASQSPSHPNSRPGSGHNSSSRPSPAPGAAPATTAARGQTPGSRPQSSGSGSGSGTATGRPVGGYMARRGGLGGSK